MSVGLFGFAFCLDLEGFFYPRASTFTFHRRIHSLLAPFH